MIKIPARKLFLQYYLLFDDSSSYELAKGILLSLEGGEESNCDHPNYHPALELHVGVQILQSDLKPKLGVESSNKLIIGTGTSAYLFFVDSEHLTENHPLSIPNNCWWQVSP